MGFHRSDGAAIGFVLRNWGAGRAGIGVVSYNTPRQIGGDADFEIPGLELDAAVLLALVCNSPSFFGVALSLTVRGIIPHIGRKIKGIIGRDEEIARFSDFFGIWAYS